MDPINSPLIIVLAGIAIIALIFWYLATELDKVKRNVGTAVVLIVTLLCGLAVMPPSEKLKGGIDLVGGIKYTVEIQPAMDEGKPVPVTAESIDQVKKTLAGRLNPSGQKDLLIQGMGENRLVVEMPGTTVEEAKQVEATILRTAKLELKEVHPENSRLAPLVEAGEELVPAGYKAYEMDIKDRENKVVGQETILLKRRNIVTGDMVARANPGNGFGVIDVKLNNEGGERLLKTTSQMRLGMDRMAVVMDDQCLIAPTVQAKLKSQFIIEGLDGPDEVRQISAALSNPLKNSLKILSSSRISAKLGKSVVQQGLIAGGIGLGLTFLFIALYYRKAGIIALIGLALNLVILFGAMAMLGATFTLAGIAGIVLTIGVAVDANVLIYERLREEMEAGKSPKSAIRASYEKAFSAIFDANITSLLTALVLFWLASSTVKGFAVTLTIGILGSMFTALLATRVLFLWVQDKPVMSKLSFMNLIPERTIDFLGKRKICFLISAGLILFSFAITGIKGNQALGIDFVGGSVIEIQLDESEKIPAKDIEASLADIQDQLNKATQVQEENVPGSGEHLTIRCDDQDVDK
ncbi:MAG: protein translocase subunit SecD, partial [Verrucomicrobiales bacterium]